MQSNGYIKYKINDDESFNKAIDKAKELGYKVWNHPFALHKECDNNKTIGVLLLFNDEGSLEYFIPLDTEEQLIKQGYECLFDYSK